jgi:hypothetical protein
MTHDISETKAETTGTGIVSQGDVASEVIGHQIFGNIKVNSAGKKRLSPTKKKELRSEEGTSF